MKCARGFHLTALDHGLSMTEENASAGFYLVFGANKGHDRPAVPGWTGIRSGVVWNEVLFEHGK
jgi:hypothetical protein